jgi:hypothetical protein
MLVCSFGTGPRTFTTTDVLPDGLTLNSSGLISGTPTTAGTTSFTVTATDALGALCTDVCQTTVVPPPIAYYGLVLTSDYAGNNTPIIETGGGDLYLASPFYSGDVVTIHLVGTYPYGGWIRVIGHTGSLSGPPFDTGYIALPGGNLSGGYYYSGPITWTAP